MRLSADSGPFLNCTLLKPAVTFRHYVIVRILAMLARKAGGACYVEPRFYVGIRPDIHIMFPTTKILVDVTVVHPSGPTFALRSHVPLFAALGRERETRLPSLRNSLKGSKRNLYPLHWNLSVLGEGVQPN